MQKKKGVSLIVLVITVLIMLVLAAAVIITLEETGIIVRSKNTTKKQNYVQEYERLLVVKNGVLTDKLGEITVEHYITELTNKGIIESTITTEADGSKTVKTKTGFDANIKQDGESNVIISLGVSDATISLNTTALSGDITSGNITRSVIATTTNITVGEIIWTTSNKDVATVIPTDTGASITMVGRGTATITATYGSKKAYVTVTVTSPAPTVSLSATTKALTVRTGATRTDTLTATVRYTTGAIAWSSSNPNVASVYGSGATGTITAKSAGTAVITVTAGGVSSSCTVTVTADNTAPTFSMSAEPEHQLYVYLSSISATTTDYPLTIKFYSKYSYEADSEYVLYNTITKTSGTSHGEYINCNTTAARTIKVEITDAAGNTTTDTRTVQAYSCFVAGTQVLTENGMKNIEDIKLGEKVYTVNLDNNQKELKVVNKLITSYTKELYELKIGNETVLTTPNHRFYIQDKGWIRANDLEVGDKIVAKGESEDMTIHSIELKLYAESVPVYNLTVDGHHNYLITKYELLVHNASSPD